MGKPVLKKLFYLLTTFLHIFYDLLVYKLSELSSVNEKYYSGTKATKFILRVFDFYSSLPSHREIMIFD